jgi:hypothetical protein
MISRVPQPPVGLPRLDAQLREIAASAVLEFDALETVLDALVRVQIRCVAGGVVRTTPGAAPDEPHSLRATLPFSDD